MILPLSLLFLPPLLPFFLLRLFLRPSGLISHAIGQSARETHAPGHITLWLHRPFAAHGGLATGAFGLRRKTRPPAHLTVQLLLIVLLRKPNVVKQCPSCPIPCPRLMQASACPAGLATIRCAGLSSLHRAGLPIIPRAGPATARFRLRHSRPIAIPPGRVLPHRPAEWGRWNSIRETFPAEYGWRAIFGEGPKSIFPPSPLLQPAGGRRAIAQSHPERPTGSRRAPFRESAVPAAVGVPILTPPTAKSAFFALGVH